MKSERELLLLKERALRKLFYLSTISEALVRPRERAEDRAATYVAIEAMNFWSCFVREHYLSCAVRHARSAGGNILTYTHAALKSERDALLLALQIVDPTRFRSVRSRPTLRRRDEPNWFNPAVIVRLSTALGLSNKSDIISATSYPTMLFRDLPVVRNFYAHRSFETARRVKTLSRQSYGILVNHPNEFSIVKWSGRTQNLLSEWVDDLKDVCRLMCG